MRIAINTNNGNGQPVPGAVITFYKDGNAFNQVAFPSNTGVLYFDTVSDADLFADGVTVRITASGYNTAGLSASELTHDFEFTLRPNGLQTALLAGAGLAAGLLYFSTRKKGKKKVSGFKDFAPGAQSAIIFGGIGLLAYFLIFKKNSSGAALKDAADKELAELAAAGIRPTMTVTQAQSYAGAILSAINDCGTDEDALYSIFSEMQNKADVLQLVSVYGVRDYKGCFDGDYFGSHSYNLSEALTAELTDSEKAIINNSLSSKGIDYKF